MKSFCLDDHAIEALIAESRKNENADGDIAAKIVALTMPAVEHVLSKTYPSFGVHYSSMIEAAAKTIWQKAQEFNLDGEDSFTLYIMPFIRSSIRAYASNLPTPELLTVYHEASEKEQAMIMEWVVANNERLVLHVINRHYSSYRHNHLEDMMQQGRMALFTYSPQFDVEKPYSFSTFITPYILDAIKTYICEVHDISPHYAVQMKKYYRAMNSLKSAGIENPTLDQIANAMGVGLDAAQKVYNISCRLNVLSIDEDEKQRRLEDPYMDSPDKIVEKKEFKESIQRAINRLTPEQQAVVRATFFSDEKKDASMNAVSLKLGMEVSRVRRLLNQAKRDLLYAPELRDYTMSREQTALADYTDSLMIDFVLPANAVEANLDIAMSLDLDF